MGDPAEAEYLKPYRDAVKRFGAGFEATLWTSREAQQLRFDVMIDLAGLEDCVVVDAGCGGGDFAARLLERNISFSSYVGLDAVPEMIEAARKRALPQCEFLVRDVVADAAALPAAEPDYVCVSGTLNTMDEETARRLIGGAFEAAGRGVAFNFLSGRPHPRWAGRDLGPARRFDPLRWLDFSLTLTSRVSFTQAYLDGHDATILLRHEAAGT
ncbi:MAG: class I SAM-dependent methyltransferase [Planctomycetota bacterium]|jgi:SAM-dependent methyltransferase